MRWSSLSSGEALGCGCGPRPLDAPVAAAGFSGDKVDRWLATDGPVPTAGLVAQRQLILDDHGPALVDAARSAARTAACRRPSFVLVTAPKSGRSWWTMISFCWPGLPTTGFEDRDLRRFCAEAGWRYYGTTSGPVAFARVRM